MKYPLSFTLLVDHLKKLPGVGKKSAERMAYQIIDMDEEFLNNFAQSLVDAKQNLGKCHICGCMCEGDTCEICKDESRDKSLICVVQTSKDVYALEKAKDYQGVYHVLNGVISAVNGVSPRDINLYSLIDRVDEIFVFNNLTSNDYKKIMDNYLIDYEDKIDIKRIKENVNEDIRGVRDLKKKLKTEIVREFLEQREEIMKVS